MPIDISSYPIVISEAFEMLREDVLAIFPALAELPLQADIWQHAMAKIIEGYGLEIRDARLLAEYGKSIFPIAIRSTRN